MAGMKEGLAALALAASAAGCYTEARVAATSPVSQQEHPIDTSAAVGMEFGGERGQHKYGVVVEYHQSHSEEPPATIDTPTLTVGFVWRRHLAGDRAKLYGAMEAFNMTEWPHIQIGEPFNVDDSPGAENTQGVGFGIGAELGKADIRVMYRRLLGTENIEGIVHASVAFVF